MKKNIFLVALLTTLLSVLAFGQTTKTYSDFEGKEVQGFPNFYWSVASADFDSADAIYSPNFSFDGFTAATFDAQGQINLGAAASGGTYSTVLLLYGCNDDPDVAANWVLVDSLGTVTSTNATKISIDLDDWDQCTWYCIKATNGGAQNSFTVGLKSEYEHR